MSRYRFELATSGDDADLRRIAAQTPTEGRIAVVLRREPSWFAGAVVDGVSRQVVACRDADTGRLVGFGCRSIRAVHINGQPALVGYLSSLRLEAAHRKRGLVARGFATLRRLHADGQVPYYLTTVAASNETALSVLTSGRAGLPRYHPAGQYHTVAIPIPRRRRIPSRTADVDVCPAHPGELPAILAFLAAAGPERQFFPCLNADDFGTPMGAMAGLVPGAILLARRGGELVGTLAAWDQTAFRQSAIHGYRGWFAWARPFYNAWAWWRGQPGLPPAGGRLRSLFGALPVVADSDPDVFAALLAGQRARAAGGPWDYLLVGLHEADPLLPVAQREQTADYTTLLFLASWPDGDEARARLDGRPPYLEAGSL